MTITARSADVHMQPGTYQLGTALRSALPGLRGKYSPSKPRPMKCYHDRSAKRYYKQEAIRCMQELEQMYPTEQSELWNRVDTSQL